MLVGYVVKFVYLFWVSNLTKIYRRVDLLRGVPEEEESHRIFRVHIYRTE